MKRSISLLLIFLLCIGLLAGCKEDTAAISYQFEDLTIQIPEDYINLSEEDIAEGLVFVFGQDPIAINGLREEKALFEAYGLDLDLQTYANLICKSNNLASAPEQKNGIWTFTYESGELTYVVTLWETEDAYWMVQAYCPTTDYSNVKNAIWDILSSVTV